MNKVNLIEATPWDTATLGMPTWQLTEYSELALQQARNTVGHHTLKVDPLADKRLLHQYGFYYCGTLIEPHCDNSRLRVITHPDATISKEIDVKLVLSICHGAFEDGRFHRDFNVPKAAADLRYDKWLKQLLDERKVYGLYWQGSLAGFIAHNDNCLVLHALARKYRGKGWSKYWWGAVCVDLLKSESYEIKSSVHASNLAIINLYASLGFYFKNPLDVYHCLIK